MKTGNVRQARGFLFPLDIAFAEDGAVWVGGAYSLARYREGTWTEFDIPAASVVAASDGTVWARGWDGRADRYCCVTHLVDDHQETYDWTTDIPADPEVLDLLFNQMQDGMEDLANPEIVFTIWQIARDGSPTELGTVTGLGLAPQFSPDLTQVGFTIATPWQSFPGEMHIARTDGSRDVLYGSGSFHIWQSDGDRFSFFSEVGSPHIGRLDDVPAPLPPIWDGYDQPSWLEWIDDQNFLYTLEDGRLFLGDLHGDTVLIGRLRPEMYLMAPSLKGFDFYLPD